MKGHVRPGIDVLLEERVDLLEGKRIGLVTNHTGVTPSLEWSVDVLHGNSRVDLRSLFAPEHGIRGDAQDSTRLNSYVDPRTGLMVFSLYGEHYKPTKDMMLDIDALVFDIQGVGARYCTYVATMNRCMEAAAEHEKEFILLDRPNPIDGITMEGNVLEESYGSFVGERPIPIRYAMTMGELAEMFNSEYGVGCELTVVRAKGWRRKMWHDETGLPWVSPSPNLPTLDSVTVYPGNCLFEGVNVSEGRGTTRPFETIGAPWIDGFKLRERLAEEDIPGVMFRALSFVPAFGKFAGETCGGIQLHVRDRREFRPVFTALKLLRTIMDLFPGRMEFRRGRDGGYVFDLLAGTAEIRQRLLEGVEPEDMEMGWRADLRDFEARRRKYLLYP
jgi:uncharacterized protein YbbC (DUF1343 family)